MQEKHYVGDIGVVFLLDCNQNVADATVKKILVRKGNGIEAEWDASVDGTNFLRHVTVLGDLDVPGVWTFQPYIETPDGKWKGRSASVTIFSKFS